MAPLVLCIMILLTSCSHVKTVDVTELETSVLDNVLENGTETSTLLSNLQGSELSAAAIEYVKQFTFSISQENNSENVLLECKITYPAINSIENSLTMSDAFVAEYEASEDKATCVWHYVTNILLSKLSLQYDAETISVSAVDQVMAFNNLTSEIDKLIAEHLSSFVLTNFYHEGRDSIKRVDESHELVYADNLNDFVFKINKHKVLVSNIKILYGDDAIKRLCELSANNIAVAIDPLETCIYVIEYTATNLTKKTVVLENYFRLGNSDGYLYDNSGFHIEGLSLPTKVPYGVSKDFVTAVVGDAESVLYFYDVDMRGSRQWKEVPLSDN